jgi:hypothetical protein
VSKLEELGQTLTAIDQDIVAMASELHVRAQACSRAAQYAAAAVRNEDGSTNTAASQAAVVLAAAARATSQAAQLLNQAANQGKAFVARTAGSRSAGSAAGAVGGGNAGGPSLSSEDFAALGDYTGTGFSAINGALREGTTMTPDTEKRSASISDALSKLPDRPGPVFRGTSLSADQIASYVPGETRKEAGFTSSSSDQTRAFPGNVLFLIISKHGKDVAPYSSYSESEVLFDKGANFHVTSNFFDLHVNKQVIIMMEV